MRLTRRFVATAGICFLTMMPLRAQTARRVTKEPADGELQMAALGDFKLQSGAVIRNFQQGYRVLGRLNAEKSNAVLWPTWLGIRSEELLAFVGPGKVVDSEKYFVVLVDAIGNGVTTSPSNSQAQPRMKFPEFTIRDMVESEYRLATQVLHLTHLHAVMGTSMGGMQTFEWAVAYPDFMDLAISMAGSPQSTAYDKLLWKAQIDAIELDPAWKGGNPTGPLTSGPLLLEEISSMNATSPAYRVAHTSPQEFEAFLTDMKRKAWMNGGTASNEIRQRQAIIRLDIPGEYGVTLEEVGHRVRAKLLVIVSPEDHTVNPAPAMKFAEAMGATVVKLDSRCGHLSFTCISVGPTVAQFLEDPASVHSMTLQDAGAH